MTLYGSNEYTLYKARDNVIRLRLTKDGTTVTQNSLIRAVLRVRVPDENDIVLDTDVPADDIDLVDNATVVEIGSEGIDSLEEGTYHCWLTVYSGDAPDGIAWVDPDIRVIGWKSDE